MAQIEQTSLYQEIKGIVDNPFIHPMRRIGLDVHLMDYDLSARALKIVNIDIVRNYEDAFADQLIITAIFPKGTFEDIIYYSKDNLEGTIYADGLSQENKENGEEDGLHRPTQTRLIMKLSSDKATDIQTKQRDGIAGVPEKDLFQPMEQVSFQCVDKTVHLTRKIEVGFIARNITIKDLILSVLTHEMANLDIPEEEKITLDMQEPDNTQVFEQIPIPTGTPLLKIPHVLQELVGIYKTGVMSYIQNKVWYIVPRQDLETVREDREQISIFVTPEKLFPRNSKTVRHDEGHWKLLCGGKIEMQEEIDVNKINQSTGFTYSSSAPILNSDYEKNQGNKSFFNFASLNVQAFTEALKGGENFLSYFGKFTANDYHTESVLKKDHFGLVELLWEYSYPSIILPGSMITIYYLSKTAMGELRGIVIQAQHSGQTVDGSHFEAGRGIQTTTGLLVLVKGTLYKEYITKPSKEVIQKRAEGATGVYRGNTMVGDGKTERSVNVPTFMNPLNLLKGKLRGY